MRTLIAKIFNISDTGQARRQADNERVRLLWADAGDIVYPHENADGKIQWTRI